MQHYGSIWGFKITETVSKNITKEEADKLLTIGAGIGAGVVMSKAPTVVMPVEDILGGIQSMLEEMFDGS